MDDFLEFFEELDEMVYISDLDTHELVYMNRQLRESLGYQNNEGYQGKKCYEVLQGGSEPCSFCSNRALEPGKFVSWSHKNPVLDKRYLIKDTIRVYNGRRYRIEIAIDVDNEVVCKTPYYYARSETILNGCLQRIFSTTDPEEKVELVLEYLGETFECDRVYVFEQDEEERINNTYEWCRSGVSPQKEILQKIPESSFGWWMEIFESNKVVSIENLEDIQQKYPVSYAILKPQNISSLAAGPISIEGRVIGFLGVDNPNREMMTLITPILSIIGYFVAALLRQRDLIKRLNSLSFHDPLTGAFNRNAMFEHGAQRPPISSIGVVYCDITGLKWTNDSMGHNAGDQLIRHCYQLLCETLNTEWIYRTGGDEFVAVYLDCGQEALKKDLRALKEKICQDRHHIAVGYVWSDDPPFNLETLISQADEVMYQNKRDYYAANSRQQSGRNIMPKAAYLNEKESEFHHFLSITYHDLEFLFQAISQRNSEGYFFFGDMQKDLFYISDNMREEFGFENNIVPGLLKEWSLKISTEKSRKMYRQAVKDMVKEKRTINDLRYQVYKRDGTKIWVRCCGMLKWNEDQSLPLFLAGRITHQDDSFVVDPITNFPRESAVFSHMEELREKQESCFAIGFSFNNITDLNSTRGCTFSDHLIRSIADELMSMLAGKMSFYRLEGMRCIAMVDPANQESKGELVRQIQKIIVAGYRAVGLSIPHPCSCAVMRYSQAHLTAADFLENMTTLIKVAKQDRDRLYVENSQDSIRRIKQMSNMALALSRDVLQGMQHFRIVIQPMVSAESGNVMGGEALLRWSFEGNDISPEIFIPMLEKEKLIQSVGRWVFDQTACCCMRLVTYIPDFYLTFNVSLQQLSDRQFTSFMKSTMEKYHVDGSHLVAEMTESCMDEQPEELFQFVNDCKAMDIKIALDDFGSGYSSLRMLLQYPSSVIKLDRSLLREMTESEDKMNFISSIVYACHRFGKQVCMEGVETGVQNALIRKCGCDMIQGYYYYRPMEIDDMYRLASIRFSNVQQNGKQG